MHDQSLTSIVNLSFSQVPLSFMQFGSDSNFWSIILLVFVIILGIQFVFYFVSVTLKTEKFFALSASVSLITTILVSLLVRQDQPHIRQIITSVLALVWAARLGLFLFNRVLRVEDKRFADRKNSAVRFTGPWILALVWIFLTALPIYVLNANSSDQVGLMWADYLGYALFGLGFLIEMIADYQKNAFKNHHPQDFVRSGLWRYSRHPNYFGEILIWIGLYFACAPSFSPVQYVTLISPIFVIVLLMFGTGVSLLEQNQLTRYGSRQDYQDYRYKTSKFFPWFPKQ